MPRAATSTTTAKKKAPTKARAKAPVRKTTATTKRVTKKVAATKPKAETKTPRKRTITKKTVAKKEETVEELVETGITSVDASVPEERVATTEKRKAPTRFSSDAKKVKARRVQLAVVGVLLTVGIGASAAVGVTDSGQIDVAQTIQERNERMANLVDVDGPTTVAAVPVNAGTPGVADGGLVGLKPAAPAPALRTPQELAALANASTSTTTPDTSDEVEESIATTSDAVAETESATSTLPVVDGVITHSATTTVQASSSESAVTE